MSVPTLFLKSTCPFCLKVVVFMSEAGLMDKVKLEKDSDENRATLQDIIGDEKLTFPALQLAAGEKPMMDSDGIIDHFVKSEGINLDTFQALPYYKTGVMQGYLRMVKHIGHAEAMDVIAGKI
ncbi:Hypothetical Protein FCC1311_039812 [Hondaea fermentalgiana]|uniref:GST N-terminal domain-containing protein n=1 Tax=Hondaea fermentalgiana TaxID=2315210 RepID=A0A2R5GDG5_9STRA|nr:Hypothetical Protein FCC1311_039812 [Hondaea fermentalgiana]|eukprot:GBG27758.1 Hypothetical Protein FCC1311_039812 [Hondaea fermentalgiana]